MYPNTKHSSDVQMPAETLDIYNIIYSPVALKIFHMESLNYKMAQN